MLNRNLTSVKAFVVFSLILVSGFTAGVALSCNPIRRDTQNLVFVTESDEYIEIEVGQMLYVKEAKGDTITVREVSDDDARSLLEEHGQG